MRGILEQPKLVRLLGYYTGTTQVSDSIIISHPWHQHDSCDMGLRSCWFSARWNNNFKHRRVSTAANFPASMTQDLPQKHVQPFFCPHGLLVKDVSTIQSYNHLEGFEQSSLRPVVLHYPASSLLTKTHPLPPILRTCPSLTCQTSDLLLVMTIESQHILRVSWQPLGPLLKVKLLVGYI